MLLNHTLYSEIPDCLDTSETVYLKRRICESQWMVCRLENSEHCIACCVNLFFFFIDVENIWAESWKSNFKLNPDLHLPAENKYIGQ